MWAKRTAAMHAELESTLQSRVRLIVVDDGSQSTVELDSLQKSMPDAVIIRSAKNRGKGHALRLGIAKATSEVILFTDADFPYELSSMQAIVQALNNGADVALGHREKDYYASVPWFRKGLSESFRFVLKSLLKFPITDTQCGLKGMNQSGKAIFKETKINRFLVDMEFIKLAVKRKVQIQPVVVQLRSDVEFSKMGISVLVPELVNFVRVIFR